MNTPNPYTRMLHSLAHRHGMTDDQYRDLLKDRFGVMSSLQLSPLQAKMLCGDLVRTLPRSSSNPKRKKSERYSELDGRDSNFATAKQIRMLEAAFVQRSYMETLTQKQEAFASFVNNKFGIAGIAWIEQADVGRILKAITQIKKTDNPKMEASNG